MAYAPKLKSHWLMHRDQTTLSNHTGPCTDTQSTLAHAPRQNTLAHAPTLKTHWHMHRDSEHTDPCTDTQMTVAHAPRQSTETQNTLAGAPRLRAHWPMHRDLEHTGSCTEIQSTLAHAPRLRAHGPMNKGPCANYRKHLRRFLARSDSVLHTLQHATQ